MSHAGTLLLTETIAKVGLDGALSTAGRPVVDVARDLGISAPSIYAWRRPDRIDKERSPKITKPQLQG